MIGVCAQLKIKRFLRHPARFCAKNCRVHCHCAILALKVLSREGFMETFKAYSLMLTIRFFEEAIERLFLEGRIMGTAHTCIGQEAVAVGVAAALGPCDALTTTHRGHGHFLARGADAGRAMAELFGRETGYSRGRGGSQMMMDPSIGFYGANGITGGSIPFCLRTRSRRADQRLRPRHGLLPRRRRVQPRRLPRIAQHRRALETPRPLHRRKQRLCHVHLHHARPR